MTGIIFPMVDERNKRGRPPKKPKPAEQEQREKQAIKDRIIEQLKEQASSMGVIQADIIKKEEDIPVVKEEQVIK